MKIIEKGGYKSIIVAIDFSEASIKALEYATSLAKEFNSQLLLLHILEFPAVFNSPKPVYAQWEISQAATDLASDLVVIATHGRTGWKHVVGSTTEGVIRFSHCPVLVVRN